MISLTSSYDGSGSSIQNIKINNKKIKETIFENLYNFENGEECVFETVLENTGNIVEITSTVATALFYSNRGDDE